MADGGRAALTAGGVIDKKFVNETKYQTKRYIWVDFLAEGGPILCWAKGNSKNENKYKKTSLLEATAFVTGMPFKVSTAEITKQRMDGSRCLCIVHPNNKAVKDGVDLRFADRSTRDLWFSTLNGVNDSPEKLSLTKMLVGNATVECPATQQSLETMFSGGMPIDAKGHPVRKHTNIFVAAFMSHQSYGQQCGLMERDVIIAVNGKDMLGQGMNVFQDVMGHCKGNNESLKFVVYRDSKSSNPLVRLVESSRPVPSGGAHEADGYKKEDEDEVEEDIIDHPSATLLLEQSVIPNHTIHCPISPTGFQTVFCGGDYIEDRTPKMVRQYYNVFIEGFKIGVENPHGKNCGLREGDVIVRVNGVDVLGKDFNIFYDTIKTIIAAENESEAILEVYRVPEGGAEEYESELAHPSADPTARVVSNCTVECTVPPQGGFSTLFAGGDPSASTSISPDGLLNEHIYVEGFATENSYGEQIGLHKNDILCGVNKNNLLGEPFEEFRRILSGAIQQGPGTKIEFDIHRANSQSAVQAVQGSEPIQGSEPSYTVDTVSNSGPPPVPPPRIFETDSLNTSDQSPSTNIVEPVSAIDRVPASVPAPPGTDIDSVAHIAIVPSTVQETTKDVDEVTQKNEPSLDPAMLPHHDIIVTCPPNPHGSGLGTMFAGGEQIDPTSQQFDDILVEKLVEGSYGKECGLRVGDQVVAVCNNSMENTSLSNFQDEVLALITADAIITFAIRRSKTSQSIIDMPVDLSVKDAMSDPVHVLIAEENSHQNSQIGESEEHENMSNGKNDNVEDDSRRNSATQMMDMDTQQWLQSLNLGHFIPTFSDMKIHTMEDIGNNLHRLQEAGLNNIQQRRLRQMLGQYRNEVYMNLESVARMHSGVMKTKKKFMSLLSPKSNASDECSDSNVDDATREIVEAEAVLSQDDPPIGIKVKNDEHDSNTPSIVSKMDQPVNETQQIKKTTVPALTKNRSHDHEHDQLPTPADKPLPKVASIDLLSPQRKVEPIAQPPPGLGPVVGLDSRNVTMEDKSYPSKIFTSPISSMRHTHGLQRSSLSAPDTSRTQASFQLAARSTRAGNEDPPLSNAAHSIAVSSLSPYIRAEQYQAMYARLSEENKRLATARNVRVLLRAVRCERMVADNNVDVAILQETLLNTKLQVAEKRQESRDLEKRYELVSKHGTAKLDDLEHKTIVLSTKTDELRTVVASDPAERVRFKLQQDKNEYLEAATSAMQHFIERERKRYVKQVQRLTKKFSPPSVLKSLQQNTQVHRFWTRSVKESMESMAQNSHRRRAIVQRLRALNESVRYDDAKQRLAQYVRAVWSIRRKFMAETWTKSLAFFQAVVPFLNDARALEIVKKVLPLLEKRWLTTLASSSRTDKRKHKAEKTLSVYAPSPPQLRFGKSRRKSGKHTSATTYNLSPSINHNITQIASPSIVSQLSPLPSNSEIDSMLYSARGFKNASHSPVYYDTTSNRKNYSATKTLRSSQKNRGLATSPQTGRMYMINDRH